MLCMGHMGWSNKKWANPYWVAGSIYPDVIYATNKVRYETTHPNKGWNERAFLKSASYYSPNVVAFAKGMQQHWEDDRRLDCLGHNTISVLPAAEHILQLITIRSVIEQIDEIVFAIAPLVLAGILEFALAKIADPNVIDMNLLSSVYSDPKIIQFIAKQWKMAVPQVHRINDLWCVFLSRLPAGDPEDLVWYEMQWVWPKAIAGKLNHLGLLTTREAIAVRKQIVANRGQILGILYGANHDLMSWPLFERWVYSLASERVTLVKSGTYTSNGKSKYREKSKAVCLANCGNRSRYSDPVCFA